MFTVISCITQDHDWRLLLVAVAIGSIAATTSLNLLARAGEATGRTRCAWTCGAAFTFGGGIWATHFIAMLAYQASLPISYSFTLTLLSVLVAMVGSMVAFCLAHRTRCALTTRLAAGLIAGGTIGAMHYLGMAAVRVPGTLLWNHTLVVGSFLVAMPLAVAAFLLFDRLANLRLRFAAAALLVLAICSLHFTGMAALTLLPTGGPSVVQVASDPLPLGTAIAAISLLILLMSQLGSIVDRRFSDQVARDSRRFRKLADATHEAVLIHANGLVLDANEALCRLLGRPAREIVARPLSDFFQGASLVSLLQPGAAVTAPDQSTELDLQITGRGTLPMEMRSYIIDHDGRPAHVALLRDLRERRASEDRIRHMAHHDALTGLANRFLFNDRLGQALAQANRSGDSEVAVLYLDLDRFKPVNDLLGHPAGDKLLQSTAQRLRAAVREGDTVARLGGDEFAIIQIDQNQPQAAAALGARLCALLGEPHNIDDQQIIIAASIGVAIFPTDAADPTALMQQADTALYRAKHEARLSGAATVRFFEPEMDMLVQQRRRLEADLRGAIGSSQMELHYQPLLRGTDRGLAGYEALLRWHHPQLGWISPATFIPVAEETGMITALGQWVLETACAEAALWNPALSIAVNLSPVQFRHPELVDTVASVLARTGLCPTRLELEVTEGVLIDNAEQALTTLHRLKALGVSIALDDFGTGYSSLSYLSRFPFDRIKIDQCFVRDMLHDTNARAIVQAIIGLGRTLNRQITAEGVETEAQADFLQDEACDQLQGFLLGRPSPAIEFANARTAAQDPAPALPYAQQLHPAAAER
jgi:diguanylate cyclase (GGDEF)-like protein